MKLRDSSGRSRFSSLRKNSRRTVLSRGNRHLLYGLRTALTPSSRTGSRDLSSHPSAAWPLRIRSEEAQMEFTSQPSPRTTGSGWKVSGMDTPISVGGSVVVAKKDSLNGLWRRRRPFDARTTRCPARGWRRLTESVIAAVWGVEYRRVTTGGDHEDAQHDPDDETTSSIGRPRGCACGSSCGRAVWVEEGPERRSHRQCTTRQRSGKVLMMICGVGSSCRRPTSHARADAAYDSGTSHARCRARTESHRRTSLMRNAAMIVDEAERITAMPGSRVRRTRGRRAQAMWPGVSPTGRSGRPPRSCRRRLVSDGESVAEARPNKDAIRARTQIRNKLPAPGAGPDTERQGPGGQGTTQSPARPASSHTTALRTSNPDPTTLRTPRPREPTRSRPRLTDGILLG